jgi:L-ribulose-5-phosphate 4-epimerase
MLEDLKKRVCDANLQLVAEGLVMKTFGNVSGIDRAAGVVVIKPSGVPYEGISPEQMVCVALDDGRIVEGDLRPSSDTPTHLELYRAWKAIGGVVHTHSPWATAWAQAREDLPALGTTHADYFHGPVPCTRRLARQEVEGDYEANTGRVVVETFAERTGPGGETISPERMPAVLVAEHGPFAWGPDPARAVHNAALLEYAALLAARTRTIVPACDAMSDHLLDKHFLRKHGPGAYYGQT